MVYVDIIYQIFKRIMYIYFVFLTCCFLFIIDILFVCIEILLIQMLSYGFRGKCGLT